MADQATRSLTLDCSDGESLAATWFGATAGSAAATLVVAAAMGVPRGFYARFAAFLASRGIEILLFDYRGMGESQLACQRGRDVRLLDWGRRDIEAALCAAEAAGRGRPAFLLGHSIGGQLVGLAPASERLAGLVMVAASLPHWRLWPPGAWQCGLAVAWYLLVPLLSAGRDMVPTRRLGFSSLDIPSGVMRDWARWSRHRRYLFDPSLGIDVTRYARLSVPLRAYVADDDGYCPAAAARALLEEFPRTNPDVVRLRAAAAGPIGHFGFFREKMRDRVWLDIAAWIRDRATSNQADG